MKSLIGGIVGILVIMWCYSFCSPAGKNKTGHEYMPDMYHAVGYEANQYTNYYWNHWDGQSTRTKAELSQPRAKVNGTVPRGQTAASYGQDISYVRGNNTMSAIAAPVNGEAPFYYQNNEDERLRCEKEMVRNPYRITKAGLAQAKPLYEVYCGICHGAKGDGQGDLVTVPDAKYPVGPKNFLEDGMSAAGNGRYYLAIMYGKNLMGAYADKLSYEERWQVIHYIRSLQATAKKLEYSEARNTLNSVDMPGSVKEPDAAIGQKVTPAHNANNATAAPKH